MDETGFVALTVTCVRGFVMKDYYKILGVDEEASEEKIRARWIELTKHYHPDLGKIDEEEDEKIKEINEAYEVLKDESKRLDYDLERVLKKSLTEKVQSRKERRMNFQRIILLAGVPIVLFIGGLIIFRWFRVPVPLKPEVVFSPPGPTVKEVPEPKEEPAQKILRKLQEPAKEGNKILKEITKEMPGERTKIGEKGSKRKEELVPQVVVKPETPAKAEFPKEAPRKVAEEVPREIAKLIPRESVRSDKPEPRVAESAPPLKSEATAIVEKRVAKEEEVRRFFVVYIDYYTRKDIDDFLSLFSPKAIQNRKDGFDGIRKIYSKFFDQSQELKYRLEDMKIEIYENLVEVKARFGVDQILRRRAEEKIWRGNIGWVLVKEEGVLKILSLDYQNDKPPEGAKGGK
jgi:curved DNA-binding protein CbpA